jgi:CRISPR/Cas system-associated endoribonuclease Cas2
MTLYVITYDVRLTNHDYKGLYDQLEKWKAAHLQNSVWLVDYNGKSKAVRDALKAHMHSDDTISVIQLAEDFDWATLRVRSEGTDWMNAHSS